MKCLAIGVLTIATLAACATAGKLTDSERLALYRGHAGAPVRSFQYFNALNGWTELGDSALAVWTKPNEAWLLELGGPCMDLSYAPAISVTNMMGQVSARFDKVIVLGANPGIGRIPCRIESIRPVDVKAVRASEKQLRQAKLEARADDAPSQ